MTVNGPLQQGLRSATVLMLTQDSSGNRGMKQQYVFLKRLATDGSHFMSRLLPVDTPERHLFPCRRRVATGLSQRALTNQVQQQALPVIFQEGGKQGKDGRALRKTLAWLCGCCSRIAGCSREKIDSRALLPV